MFDCGPRAFRPLAAVKRILAGHALPPGVDAVAVDGQQKNLAAYGAFKARLEKLDERHLNFAKGDSFNFHILKSDSPHWFAEYIHFSSQRPSKNLPLPCSSRS